MSAATSKIPQKSSYHNLFNAVKTVLSSGLADVQRLIEYQRVKTYWTIGQTILKQAGAPNTDISLGQQLYQQISLDIERALGLELTADTIQRCVQFGKTYPRFPENTPLTFTHYLALMRVTDARKRQKLEQEAIAGGQSTVLLKERVRDFSEALVLAPTVNDGIKLAVERGEPYIYILRQLNGLNDEQEWCVDCGFKIHMPLGNQIALSSKIKTIKDFRYVSSKKIGEKYDVRLAIRKRASVYTYASRVIKIIDGDTMDALIDVGFGIRIRERLRLKGIDTPEINTRAGQNARAFVTKHLAQCSIIIIRTFKAEMYGRWLADIFTLPGTTDPLKIAQEGVCLNQILLDNGLAKKYE